MKTLTVRVMSFLAAIALAMVFTASAARACADIVVGIGWSCDLTGEDSQWCYYDCECHGISEATCGNRLGLAGFELI